MKPRLARGMGWAIVTTGTLMLALGLVALLVEPRVTFGGPVSVETRALVMAMVKATNVTFGWVMVAVGALVAGLGGGVLLAARSEPAAPAARG